ncbi:two-component system CitB family sensor kinase [Planomicrobium soli]|uniref:histidine kinase n=1 Tax=Planomicrobium soli TaxID=1176648 RepID=A0A2P8GQI5_9BACL|nr:sensor histidine kinase [Planomicrobium soli]PSL36223.1 two-component system CitB family sensor kinase [Planomicrobium soli]
MPLQRRIFLYGALFISAIMVLAGLSFYMTISGAIEKQVGTRALDIAETTAARQDIRKAFELPNPSAALQPLAEKIRIQTGAEYVVIGNKDGIRYAHPREEQIGKKMVGDDNQRALVNGEVYVSEATGTLGPALRGKAPIYDSAGNIIGIISVGFLKTSMTSTFLDYADSIIGIVIIAIAIGTIGSMVLARNIKKTLFGLEPAEIASLYTERNALIESVREGIIMVNKQGEITMANASAYEALSFPEDKQLVGRSIEDIVPNTQLPQVLETGESQLDRPMTIRGKKTIVNRIPIRYEDRIIGAVSSFRLQSDIEGLRNELSQVRQYADALRAQTHEHNNLLYTISGLIQLQSLEEAMELIHDETEEQQSLVHFITKRVHDPLIGGIIIGLFNRARELKVKFLLDGESLLEQLPPHFEKSLFISILGNLVTNAFEAVEHLPEDQRMVRLLLSNNGYELLIEVEDSGEGLDPAIFAHLFKERVSTKEGGDRGYGLIKVDENVRELNGSIAMESGDLGGALFIISITIGGNEHD